MTTAYPLMRVMTKASKRNGLVYESRESEYLVRLVKNKSISIFTEKNGEVKPGASFQIGDQAEYSSYNLHYLGTITAFTEKTVTIVSYKGSRIEEAHRLSLHEFCWRNADFDLAQVQAQNHEISMNI
jgi:hypothetical protein